MTESYEEDYTETPTDFSWKLALEPSEGAASKYRQKL